MYARVLTATVEPGRLDELATALNEAIQTTIKHRHGFKHAFVLTDPGTNKVMAISMWETEADRDAHVAAGSSVWETPGALEATVAAGRVPKHHAEAVKALTSPKVEEFYEVSVQEQA